MPRTCTGSAVNLCAASAPCLVNQDTGQFLREALVRSRFPPFRLQRNGRGRSEAQVLLFRLYKASTGTPPFSRISYPSLLSERRRNLKPVPSSEGATPRRRFLGSRGARPKQIVNRALRAVEIFDKKSLVIFFENTTVAVSKEAQCASLVAANPIYFLRRV